MDILFKMNDNSVEPIPPVQLMIYHNDCMFMSNYCKLGFIKINAIAPPKKTVFFLGSAFEVLATKFIDAQFKLHQASFRDFYMTAKGLKVVDKNRRLLVDKSIRKLIHHLQHVSKPLKVL
jgi:hypothetical protein